MHEIESVNLIWLLFYETMVLRPKTSIRKSARKWSPRKIGTYAPRNGRQFRNEWSNDCIHNSHLKKESRFALFNRDENRRVLKRANLLSFLYLLKPTKRLENDVFLVIFILTGRYWARGVVAHDKFASKKNRIKIVVSLSINFHLDFITTKLTYTFCINI